MVGEAVVGAVGLGAVLGWSSANPRPPLPRLASLALAAVALAAAALGGGALGLWPAGEPAWDSAWTPFAALIVSFAVRSLVDLELEKQATNGRST